MTTRPPRTRVRSGRDSALVAVTTTAAGAVRAATAQTSRDADGPGPIVGSVCTGYGGLDLGVLAALGGGRLAWCADPDPHISAILAARLPGIPNLGDVRAIDWTNVEPVDVLTAGFPCQDISAAGRRVGIEKGHRSGLWTDIVAGVRVLRPALLVVENVAALRWKGGGLHRVLGDLAEAGYDALWRSVRAADVGAAHRRERVFLLAWPRPVAAPDAADPAGARRRQPRSGGPGAASGWWASSESARRGGRGDEAAAHADRLGLEELHSQDAGWWAVVARRGAAAADAEGVGHGHGGASGGRRVSAAVVAAGASVGGPRGVPADAAGDRRDEGLSGAAGVEGRPDAAVGGNAPARPGSGRRHLVAVADPDLASSPAAHREVDWGDYAPAVQRWEQVLGRPAPFPTQPGVHGRPVLAPAFVEWLQGLEPGWVTGLPLPRTAQLRALGNGVVPQQATHAVGLLLADLAALLGAGSTEPSGYAEEANAA
ncbi:MULTISPECIES: DNA cytosine methyltransferase [unclassified Crossiella]|uniref:DNA cytosine methyltransferase n=1 Tax=unclassified Crossiella TaxID=2620835 RepID=UPI001FFFFEFA|nr:MULTISPECIES: DNA cytosine methyltransferase [unclassified Crossiella]MCK2238137.1 DNA cytosine methyltransferase [Crossiella sp. S99.2]MCK2256177.1 DNA cytosine methyltransferase [Crossiella sp. S99.1]